MPLIGQLALALALVLAVYAVVANVLGAVYGIPSLIGSGRHAIWAMCAMVAVGAMALWSSLLHSDFSLEYVASYSSSTLPTFYKITSLWGGQQGSLLLWTLLLSTFTSIAAFQNRKRNPEVAPYALAVLAVVAIFFLGMLNFVTRPFDMLAVVPREGQDLNPLLQNYWMAIHPPSLYTGYVSASVPFAFGAAALITGRLDDGWIRATRRWAIFSWFFLTLGNMFGARWAYEVLGWGGYWAWDPVENAAFMPWLVMTAYLHSVMIQERKDMLKIWNLVLIGLAFSLTLFGTFLTRSGVISSVHSFTQSGLGPYFLTFLVIVIVAYTGLLLWRVKDLRGPAEFESYLSREAAFLFNNLILVGIAFAVFWGTVFPVLSEAVRGVKITVGPPFFDKVNAPLALGLIFLMGVGPLIAWRRSAWDRLLRAFASPALFGVLAGAAAFVAGLREWYVLVALSLAAFVLGSILVEFRRGVSARRHMVHESAPRALVNLVGKNNRRYGGYIIHLGVILAFIGIVASSFFRVEVKKSVKQGDSFVVGPYELEYDGVNATETPHVESLQARVRVFREGSLVATMEPAKLFFKREQQPATTVAIRSTPLRDLYIVLAGIDDDGGRATFQVFLTPLVFWLWAGGLMMAFGTVIVMWPNVRERAAIAATVRRAGQIEPVEKSYLVAISTKSRRCRLILIALAGLTAILAAGVPMLIAQTPKASVDEVAEGLTCQCGCGLTVANCNHPNCSFSVPAKDKIETLINHGVGRAAIIAQFRTEYGEKILSAPTTQGFNLLAWITPFVMLLGGGGLIVLVLGRWRARGHASPAMAPEMAAGPSAADAELRRQLARDLHDRI